MSGPNERKGPTDRLSVGPDGKAWETQPKWRRDFPIDWPRDEYVTRRDFTQYMVLVSLSFLVGQVWILARGIRREKERLSPQRIANRGQIPVGGSMIFSFPNPKRQAVLVRLSEDRFVAYDRACTHLLCPVIAEPERGHLYCPCHHGVFDIETGRPIAGPPERPLPRVALEMQGDEIFAVDIEDRAV